MTTRKAEASGRARSSTTEKALIVLETLAAVENDGFISLVELSRAAGMEKAVVYRILNSLLATGYAEKQDARYRLSLKLLEISLNAARSKSLADVAHPHLEELAALSGERAFLAVLDRHEVVQVDKVEGNPRIRVVSEVGTRFPLQCTSSGKLFLAYMPEAWTRGFLAQNEIEKCTDRTVATEERLLQELALVRSRGYAASDEQYREHERSIAAPLFRNDKEIVGAIGIAGTTVTFKDAQLESLIPPLMEHARRVSSAFTLAEG
jgi:DNA-binding IclR family transcriptional regulator